MDLQSKGVCTLIIDGTDIGWFSTFSGGAAAAETVADRSPGDVFPTQAGGDKALEPITITRRSRPGRDTATLRRFVGARVGKTDAATVGVKDLDENGNPVADGDTYIGTITNSTPPEIDLNSANQPKVWSITIQPSRKR